MPELVEIEQEPRDAEPVPIAEPNDEGVVEEEQHANDNVSDSSEDLDEPNVDEHENRVELLYHSSKMGLVNNHLFDKSYHNGSFIIAFKGSPAELL